MTGMHTISVLSTESLKTGWYRFEIYYMNQEISTKHKSICVHHEVVVKNANFS